MVKNIHEREYGAVTDSFISKILAECICGIRMILLL